MVLPQIIAQALFEDESKRKTNYAGFLYCTSPNFVSFYVIKYLIDKYQVISCYPLKGNL